MYLGETRNAPSGLVTRYRINSVCIVTLPEAHVPYVCHTVFVNLCPVFLLLTVVFEKGEFDYMQPSAECYRRQMLKSVEKFGAGQFDHNNHTHVCFGKVHFVNITHVVYCKVYRYVMNGAL